ncbi:MAG: aminotransferase class I/II-fold pyridoxal phosphate-dependent enzyme [Bacteroidota bacterium]|nr:aminotransferase class I/II-fold pyridoxal phosphate-dependent enzyme [Bacteroidota bacterium]
MTIEAARRTDQVSEYYFSRKLKEIEKMNAKGMEVINLGIGNPDLPPPIQAIEKAKEYISKENGHGYQSYRGTIEFRNSISAWYEKYYGVTLDSENEVLPLMGSKEGIFYISMAFLNPGETALVPDPGYPSYASVTRLIGGEVLPYELKEENSWFPDLNSLEEHDLTNVKIMWVSYPHMPTGAIPTEKLFRDLIKFGLRNNILICLDNPYSFILNKNPLSIFSVPESKQVALELNSLSKSHNMAGWRLGMLSGRNDYIEKVLKVTSNIQSGMFLALQKAAIEALNLPVSWYDNLNSVYESRREHAWDILDQLACSYEKKQAGLFVWAKIPEKEIDSYSYSDRILEKTKVFITPGAIFGEQGKNYLRISICNDIAVLEKAGNRIIKDL